ncbi:MAG: zinc ribbon domain-containing protein [Nitrososphaerota archaeon]|nr:zinc ribbon domain-containing protein [Nitrososphaerota archaeon]MDG6939903.1 zinc ribbon domain-containing protein [Nitrososphaerota archaeon]
MFCSKCGTQLPDDAKFCLKCGWSVGSQQPPPQQPAAQQAVVAQTGVTSFKCGSCGAPISPKFGEMVITCEYCGSSVSLGSQGWTNIQKHTMLPLKLGTKDEVTATVRGMMDRGLLHRHLQESSALEEISLTLVPYWVVASSARTSVVATDMTSEVGSIATTAALMGVMGAGMGGGRRGMGFGGGLMEGAMFGSVMTGGGGHLKTYQLDANYNYPVVALKALTVYQPKDYQFALQERTLFDMSKVPKGIKVLNGDVSEDSAKSQAKTDVDQLQSQRAHAKYHMIHSITTQVDVSDAELLHAPVWLARYDHKGRKIVLVVDGNSGTAVNSIGL